MPGPLPKPAANRRRTNAPTIPTTNLPAGGRSAAAPRPPSWVKLGPAGTAWWRWAWKTPEAAGWSTGDAPAVARRAELQDLWETLGSADSLDFEAMLDGADVTEHVKQVIGTLQSLAGGALAVSREMTQLEDRLGLNAKGRAALRWTIVAAPAEDEKPAARRSASIHRLRAVDAGAVAGA